MLSLRRPLMQHLLISVFIFLSVSFDRERKKIREFLAWKGREHVTNFMVVKYRENLLGQLLRVLSVDLLVPFIDIIHRPFCRRLRETILKQKLSSSG